MQKKLLFYISLENIDTSLEELKALFEISKTKARTNKKNNLVLVSASATDQKIKQICERSSQIKSSGELIKTIKDLTISSLESIPWAKLVRSPFCVKVIDFTKKHDSALAARLASPIWWSLSDANKIPSVNLTSPKTLIKFYITKKEIFITRNIWSAKPGRFKDREPQKRPGFHPTTLKPKLARLLVNLARAKKSKKILDPFCGMGAILIEAALIGCNALGSDANKDVVDLAKKNLKFFKVKGEIKKADATKLGKDYKENSVYAIATDPPYGRASHISAKNIYELYKKFFQSAQKVLKKDHFLVTIYPHYVKIKPLINKKQFSVTKELGQYVHGGLTRKILILKKK